MRQLLVVIICSTILLSCQRERSIAVRSDLALDSILENAVKQRHIPGGVAMVIKNDSLVFQKAFGYQQLDQKIKMQENTIFRLASMTKGLTAVAVLQLVEAGKIDLQDPVYKYIPAFHSPKKLTEVLPDSTYHAVPARSDITIHQLLTHTSGIGYGFQDEDYNKIVLKNQVSEGFCEDNRTSMENTLKIAGLPLLKEPGAANIYSMSYDVLGTLIEVVTGLRYDQYIQKYLLDPMDMEDSYFIIPKEKRSRLADVYQPDEKGDGLEPTSYPDIHYPVIEERRFFSGGADLCATAADYLKFMQMIHHKGLYRGKRILGEEFVEMMLTKQTPFEDGDSDQGYAAWVVNEKGAKNGTMTKGSYGFGGFFDTYAWTDPNLDFTAILLLQMYPTNTHGVHETFQSYTYAYMNNF